MRSFVNNARKIALEWSAPLPTDPYHREFTGGDDIENLSYELKVRRVTLHPPRKSDGSLDDEYYERDYDEFANSNGTNST